jgi:anaerobic magnesium-protoporphyrin IX monomethyl ester cyclase
MKIALVLPPITLQERYNRAIALVAGSLPPLGLLSIASVLKEAGHEIVVLDGTIRTFVEILKALEAFKPEVVGVTSMTLMWPKVKILSREIKARWPHINVIVGGVHPSIVREKAFEEIPDIDAVAWGEGEFSMLEYIKKIEDKTEPRIDGLSYKTAGGLVKGGERKPISDLDSLPIPDRSLLPIAEYTGAFEQYRRVPITNMMTSRGCPFQCLFCLPGLLGPGVRYRSPEKVMEEIVYLVNTFGIKDIAFWDDTFTLNKKRVLAICDYLKSGKTGVIWSAQARADTMDEELARNMAEAGCWKIFFGIESLVQKNLDTLKKQESVEEIFNAVRAAKKFGIEVEGSFIFGIPNETYAEGRETIRLARILDLDYAKFFYLTPYGALLKDAEKYGTLMSKDTAGSSSGSSLVFVPYSMTAQELRKLYSQAYIKFYFRWRVIYRRLKKMNNLLEVKKNLFGFLALTFFVLEAVSRVFNGRCRVDRDPRTPGKS